MARGNIPFKKSGSADEITFERAASPSKYESLIEEASRLNHKQTLSIALLPGDDAEKARLRIRQALNRYVPEDVRAIKRFLVRKAKGAIVVVAVLHSRDA